MRRRTLIYPGILSSLFLGLKPSSAYGLLPSVTTGARIAVHTVFFQFKEGTPQDRIDSMFARIEALQGSVPGILDIAFGKDFTLRAKNFTHAVTIRFANRAALASFYSHPAHQRLITEAIKPIVEELLPLDYENRAAAKQ